MENNAKSPGNPEFTLKGKIEYELKFGDKGIELIYDQNNPAKLIALLISQQVAENAKANLNEHLPFNKGDKKFVDRLNWAGKTVTGLDIFIGSFIDLVIQENTLPIITNGVAESAGLSGTDTTQKTDDPNTLTGNEPISTITLQNPVEDE